MLIFIISNKMSLKTLISIKTSLWEKKTNYDIDYVMWLIQSKYELMRTSSCLKNLGTILRITTIKVEAKLPSHIKSYAHRLCFWAQVKRKQIVHITSGDRLYRLSVEIANKTEYYVDSSWRLLHLNGLSSKQKKEKKKCEPVRDLASL